MVELYSSFLSKEEQACRRVLYEACHDNLRFESLDEERKGQINHALAAANLIAFLRLKHRLPAKEVMQLLGSGADRLDRAAGQTGYYRYRESLTGERVWPQLRSFAQEYRDLYDLEPEVESGSAGTTTESLS